VSSGTGRDFDGRLSKPELLQGLAQQGFTNLEGTREFELLWETCEKITTNREGPGGAESEEEGEGLGPELAGARRGVSSGQLSARKGRGGRKDENRITFAAFKRIVQRLKMELLFLPPMAMRQKQLATKDRIEERGEHGRFTQSRSPLPFGRAAGEMAPTTEHEGGAEGLPAEGLEDVIKNGLSTLAGSAPKLHSGAGVGDESRGLHVGSELSIAVGGFPDGRITPALYPDYGTTCPAYFLVDEDEEGENGGRKNSTGQGRMEVVKFSSLDYNEKTYSAEIPVADTYAFFTTHRDPKDFMMRWLYLEGLDRLTILRFAIKYSLHPLCVEDALKLEDQQPKVNKYGCHYFIVMPFFRLTRESREVREGGIKGETSFFSCTQGAALASKAFFPTFSPFLFHPLSRPLPPIFRGFSGLENPSPAATPQLEYHQIHGRSGCSLGAWGHGSEGARGASGLGAGLAERSPPQRERVVV